MFPERYDLKANNNSTSFEFYSEGPKGRILKMVLFTLTDYPAVYNLGFGDKVLESETFNDSIVSDNGDHKKILATVAYAVYIFTNKYPDVWIYATGSTSTRNRLYRMGISKYLILLQKDYELLGETVEYWENFKKGGSYSAFLFKRKSL